jgi:hypothetical protein
MGLESVLTITINIKNKNTCQNNSTHSPEDGNGANSRNTMYIKKTLFKI